MTARLVSVIVPTRNRATTLREALESIYAQAGAGELFEIEVIVIDDASTDATADVVARYPQTRYLRFQERRDVAAARNAGVDISRGEFVAFLDDDDLWLPDKLRVQVPALAANPQAGVVYSPYVIRWDDGESVFRGGRRGPSGWVFQAMLKENVCGCPVGLLIRRAALDAVGPFDATLQSSQDYDMWLRLSLRFPFLFVVGLVGVYRPAAYGKYAVSIKDGSHGETLRRIVEKALAQLPETPQYERLRHETRTTVESQVVTELAAASDATSARERTIQALLRCPLIVGDPRVREAIAVIGRRVAVGSASPISSTRAFCSELRDAIARSSLASVGRAAVGRLFAAVWAELAVGLLLTSPPRRWEACSAVVTAAGYAPSQLARRAVQGWLRTGRRGR